MKLFLQILIWVGINCFLVQAQIINNIPYTKYNTLLYFGVNPDFSQYSFNSDHDLGMLNVASGRWKIWVTAYKFSLAGLPSGRTIKDLTIKAHVTNYSVYEDYFKANLGLAQNNLDLTSASAIQNASTNLITSFGYHDIVTYNMASFITQQHIQDEYFIIIAYDTQPGSENTYAKLSISIDLDYSQINVTADNNFTDNGGNSTHGSIKVDGNTYIAPYSFPRNNGVNLSLEAISPQTDNQGYQEIWNTSSCKQSQWTIKRSGQFKSYNQTYSFTVSSDNDGKTYLANFYQNRVTTSGTMSSDENWVSNVSLTGNVTVPSGVTLTITSCANVSLNGHSIISTGGTITNNGSISGLAAKLKNGSNITGFFSTVQGALNSAANGNTVEIQPRYIYGKSYCALRYYY